MSAHHSLIHTHDTVLILTRKINLMNIPGICIFLNFFKPRYRRKANVFIFRSSPPSIDSIPIFDKWGKDNILHDLQTAASQWTLTQLFSPMNSIAHSMMRYVKHICPSMSPEVKNAHVWLGYWFGTTIKRAPTVCIGPDAESISHGESSVSLNQAKRLLYSMFHAKATTLSINNTYHVCYITSAMRFTKTSPAWATAWTCWPFCASFVAASSFHLNQQRKESG